MIRHAARTKREIIKSRLRMPTIIAVMLGSFLMGYGLVKLISDAGETGESEYVFVACEFPVFGIV